MRPRVVRRIAPGILIGLVGDEVVVVVQTDSASVVTRALNDLPVPVPGRGKDVFLALPGGERVQLDYRVDPCDLDRYPVVPNAATLR